MTIKALLLLLVVFGSDERSFSVELKPNAIVKSSSTMAPEISVQCQDVSFDQDAHAGFQSDESFMDLGPDQRLAFHSKESFTIRVGIRTSTTRFCTPLMCRDGDSVNYSLVIGRTPGSISFETWSWGREKTLSTTRINDAEWHDIVAAYDARSRKAVLWVDDRVEAVRTISGTFVVPAAPRLRLGNNIGAHQPFPGDLRDLHIHSGLPPKFDADLAEWEALETLDAGTVDAMFEKWLQRHRHPQRPLASSPSDWQEKANVISAKVQDALGLFPPPYAKDPSRRNASVPSPISPRWNPLKDPPTNFPTLKTTLPLDVRLAGQRTLDGASVTRVYWKAFEGYDASGWLYLPDPMADKDEKRPAILCPHGHWQDGARHPVVQARCWTLARHGYVVLAVDSAHTLDDAIGLSPLSVMIWSDLRGLELLRSLAYVDPNRIGCTGASGGGQQTFYLTGLRSGLAAAVPAVMVCYFEEILLSSGVHCYCNFVPGILGNADEPEMSAVFAPRPQLFLSVSGDWTKNFPRQGYPEIQDIYELFGTPSNVASIQWDCGHDYHRDMRNKMYAFFDLHLRGRTNGNAEIEEENTALLSLDEMNALERAPGVSVSLDFGAVSAEFRERLSSPKITAESLGGENERTLEDLRRRLIDRFEIPYSVPSPNVLSVEATTYSGLRARRLHIQSEVDVTLPALLFLPDSASLEPSALAQSKADSKTPRIVTHYSENHPVVLWVSSHGVRGILLQHRDAIDEFVKMGIAVLLVDIRYTGELDRAVSWRDAYGRIFSRGEGILAVHDIRRSIDAIENSEFLDPIRIAIIGDADHGAAALYASSLDPRISVLIIPSLGPNYGDRARRPAISGILRSGDIDDALCLAPRWTSIGRWMDHGIPNLSWTQRFSGKEGSFQSSSKSLSSKDVLEFAQKALVRRPLNRLSK